MSTPEAQATAAARAELYETLGQLRERLDYAKRIDNSVARTKRRMIAQKAERPVAFAAGVVGAAALVGVVAWTAVRAATKLFD